jgi:hypothetical protein
MPDDLKSTEHDQRFRTWLSALSDTDIKILFEHVVITRCEAIEECVHYLRINGFDAAETCLTRRFRNELRLAHA